MAKLITSLFMISFLLCFTLSCAARRDPAHPKDSPMATQQRETETGDAEVEVEESCEGIGEDECLMRRTLVAHTDYIYTQKTKP